MDIDYDLSQIMNAIKTKEQQNHTALKFFSTATTINNRRRHAYIGTTIATSEIDAISWKQNAAHSQVDKLIFTLFLYLNIILETNSGTFNCINVCLW